MKKSYQYQMLIEVWKEDGYNDVSGGRIDCENHCNANFSDIRFIGNDSEVLDYWIENSSEDTGYIFFQFFFKSLEAELLQ